MKELVIQNKFKTTVLGGFLLGSGLTIGIHAAFNLDAVMMIPALFLTGLGSFLTNYCSEL